MTSGQKFVEYNEFERLLSDDLNLQQSYAASHVGQVMRRVLSKVALGFHEYRNPGLEVDAVALPVGDYGTVHTVVSGLMVRPDNASGMLIDGGLLAMFDPAWPGLTPNDSPFILVDSPGVTSLSDLPFSPNGSGSPRIDIVECRAVPGPVVSETRGIFNPTTRQFVGTVVPKYGGAVAEFRIRAGTPNAGFPAVDQAWCPLAFVVIQSGAAGFNQSDVYDVRPLYDQRSNERGSTGFNISTGPVVTNGAVFERQVNPTASKLGMGWFRGEYNGYLVGGVIQRNTPSSLADFGGAGTAVYIDTGATGGNRCQGASAPLAAVKSLTPLCAVFPRGLGRCVRYSQAAASSEWAGQASLSGRLPTGANGILVLASPQVITPSGEVVLQSLPAAFGTGGSQSYGGVIAGWCQQDPTSNELQFMTSRGKKHRWFNSSGNSSNTNWVVSGGTNAKTLTGTIQAADQGSELTWDTAPNRVPVCAARVTLRSIVNWSLDNVGTVEMGQVTVTLQPVIGSGQAIRYGNQRNGSMAGAEVADTHGFIDETTIDCCAATLPWSSGNDVEFTRSFDRVGPGSTNIDQCDGYFHIVEWEDN